ncbi:MAG: glycosyltransferase [Actinomycetota bacterium]
MRRRARTHDRQPSHPTTSHIPTLVAEVELTDWPRWRLPAGRHADERYTHARLLLRGDAEPGGLLGVDLPGVERAHVELSDVLATLEPPRPERRRREQQRVATYPARAQSVVIGTRERPDDVVRCTQAVLAAEGDAPVEVIVVDNGSTTTATPDAVAEAFGHDDRVTCLSTPIPGLSRARNLGLRRAQYDVTSFLSDDIVVDPLWRRAVARGFSRSHEVAGVTGVCPPLYLDNDVQRRFEGLIGSGWKPGFTPQVLSWSREPGTALPFSLALAHGSNMSFLTESMRSLDGFDERLGPGTPVYNGEDLEFVWRICTSGGRVAFEPAAIGWNAEDYDGRTMRSILWRYGIGLTASLMTQRKVAEFRTNLLRELPRLLPGLHRPSLETDRGDFGAKPTVSESATTAVARSLGPPAYLLASLRRWRNG